MIKTRTMTAGVDTQTHVAIQSLLAGRRPNMSQLSADAQEALDDIISGRRPQRISREYLAVYCAVLAEAPVTKSGYVDWQALTAQSEANVYFAYGRVDSPDPTWDTPLGEF